MGERVVSLIYDIFDLRLLFLFDIYALDGLFLANSNQGLDQNLYNFIIQMIN